MFHVACTDYRDVFHFHCTGALKFHQLMCAIHGSVAIWIDQFFLVVASLAMTHHDKTRPNTLDWKPKEVTGAVVGLMDKKSGEVHLSVKSCAHVRAKEESHNVCALEHGGHRIV